MKHIVSIGCSHTFGHGLPDIHPMVTEKPSKLSWSNLVSKYYRTTHENLSIPGGSNDYILRKFIEHSSKNPEIQNTLYMLMWSFPSRTEIMYDTHWTRVGNWMARPGPTVNNLPTPVRNFAKNFYNYLYNDEYGKYMSTKNIYLSQVHAKLHQINLFSCWVLPMEFVHFPVFEDEIFDIDFHSIRNDDALDIVHPGPNSHKSFAEKVIERISPLF